MYPKMTNTESESVLVSRCYDVATAKNDILELGRFTYFDANLFLIAAKLICGVHPEESNKLKTAGKGILVRLKRAPASHEDLVRNNVVPRMEGFKDLFVSRLFGAE